MFVGFDAARVHAFSRTWFHAGFCQFHGEGNHHDFRWRAGFIAGFMLGFMPRFMCASIAGVMHGFMPVSFCLLLCWLACLLACVLVLRAQPVI